MTNLMTYVKDVKEKDNIVFPGDLRNREIARLYVQDNNIDPIIDENTYFAYKKLIKEVLPLAICTSINKNKTDVVVYIDFEKITNRDLFVSTAIIEYPIEDKLYKRLHLVIDKLAFLDYISEIPSIVIGYSKDVFECHFDLKTITKFYYEEIQKEEYMLKRTK